MTSSWPGAFGDLLRELRADRGRPAFIDCSSPSSVRLVGLLASLVDEVVSVGQRVGAMTQAPSAAQLVPTAWPATTLMVDIDALFTPSLQVDVLSQLRRTAQQTALIVAWPGKIAAARLTYSLPGRADHLDEPARDLVVLRPVDAEFPDEIPYTVERYPA